MTDVQRCQRAEQIVRRNGLLPKEDAPPYGAIEVVPQAVPSPWHRLVQDIADALAQVERETWETAYKLLCADCRNDTPLSNESGKSWGDCWVHTEGKIQLGICGADTLRRRAAGGGGGFND